MANLGSKIIEVSSSYKNLAEELNIQFEAEKIYQIQIMNTKLFNGVYQPAAAYLREGTDGDGCFIWDNKTVSYTAKADTPLYIKPTIDNVYVNVSE